MFRLVRDGDVERDMQYVREPYFANNVRIFYRPVGMKGQRRLDKEDAISVINELEDVVCHGVFHDTAVAAL